MSRNAKEIYQQNSKLQKFFKQSSKTEENFHHHQPRPELDAEKHSKLKTKSPFAKSPILAKNRLSASSSALSNYKKGVMSKRKSLPPFDRTDKKQVPSAFDQFEKVEHLRMPPSMISKSPSINIRLLNKYPSNKSLPQESERPTQHEKHRPKINDPSLDIDILQQKSSQSKFIEGHSSKISFQTQQISRKQAEDLGFLKEMVRRKGQDLIFEGHPTSPQLDQGSRSDRTAATSNSQPSAATSLQNIQRLKLLKKNKDYEFYDNLVHDLLVEIKNSKKYEKVMTHSSTLTNSAEQGTRSGEQGSADPSPQKPFESGGEERKDQNARNDETTVSLKKYKESILSRRKNLATFSNKGSLLYQTNPGSSEGRVQDLNGSPKKKSPTSFFQSNKKQSMIFRLSNLSSDDIYDRKIASFIEFVYKINYSNGFYMGLSLSRPPTIFAKHHRSNSNGNADTMSPRKGVGRCAQQFPKGPETDAYQQKAMRKYKVKVGRGNNSQLIKSIIKRRFWLEICHSKEQCDFIWTQDTQKDVHELQKTVMKSEQRKIIRQNLKHQQKSNCGIQESDRVWERNEEERQSQQFPSPLLTTPSFYTQQTNKKYTTPIYSAETNLKIFSSKEEAEECTAHFLKSQQGRIAPAHIPSLKSLTASLTPPNKRYPLTNHIPNNSVIGSKKILFKLMHWYYKEIEQIDPFTYLPLTYHIVPGDREDRGMREFLKNQVSTQRPRTWIVKPGENTNRGNGIELSTTHSVQKLMRLKRFHKNGEPKTFIVQKYLRPFLYQGRKFDIRHYLLLTSYNGCIKAYWYKDGYIRTASEKYDSDEIDNEFIHLTNDAIQKESEKYGKYEEANKLSYSTFQRYLDGQYPHKKYSFTEGVLKEMKKMTIDCVRAGFMFMDRDREGMEKVSSRNARSGHSQKQQYSLPSGFNFELFGMDFMLDHKFKPYLIEINANPCLEINCPLMERIVPILIEHTFRLAVDPLLPPKEHYPISHRYQLSDKALEKMKYELIFDEKSAEGADLRRKYRDAEAKFEGNGLAFEPQEDVFDEQEEEGSDEEDEPSADQRLQSKQEGKQTQGKSSRQKNEKLISVGSSRRERAKNKQKNYEKLLQQMDS